MEWNYREVFRMRNAIIGSFLLSILHSILFFRVRPGISVLLFMIPLVLWLVYILNKNGKIKNSKMLILIIPILLLSATYFIFDNTLFAVLNAIVIVVLTCSMVIGVSKEKLELPNWISKIVILLIGSLEFVGDSCKEIKKLFTAEKVETSDRKSKIRKIGKAILISLPILLVVLLLLISADDAFANLFKGIEEQLLKFLNTQEIAYFLCRILLIGIVFIYSLSILYNILKEDTSFSYLTENGESTRKLKIESFTINTLLTLLNIVYLVFSIVQISSFASNSFTKIEQYSRSARQGFFQLMVVSFINFAIIILSSKNKAEGSKKYTKGMNIFMVIFTFVILLVSFQRMYLYESNYGYTYLRLLVYYTLLTEVILMVPTIIYILKEKISLFKSYFAIIVTMYVILNFINIDKLIAKENVNRYLEGKHADISYVRNNVGTEAIPELIRFHEAIKNSSKEEDIQEDRLVENYLYNCKKKQKDEKQDWQSFNIARSQARKALEEATFNYRTYQTKNSGRNEIYY